jgi:hypothetical protein
VGQADQERAHHGAVGLLQRALIGLAIGAALAAALFVVVDRIDASGQAQERRALLARNADLTREAMQPGSALSCLDIEAVPSVEKACELSVFATPHALAAAASYVAERIKLLDAANVLAKAGDTQIFAALTHERRALERDRFGIAAHVLAHRYACSAEKCEPLTLFKDSGTLKADLAARPFDALVAKYEGVWDKPGEARAPVAELPVVPGISPPAADAMARADVPGAPHPLDPKWKLPSAQSIPPVSIMAPEPKLPKTEEPKPAEQKQAEQKPDAKRSPSQAPAPAEAR